MDTSCHQPVPDMAAYNLHEPSTSTANCCCQEAFPKNSLRNSAFIDQFRVAPTSKNLIQELIEVDRLDELINLKGLRIRPEHQNMDENLTAYQRLSRIGDEVLEHLVDWTKTLPFYDDFPVEVHSCLLTQRWPELVLLSACFFALCMQDEENILPVTSTTFEQNETISFTDASINLQLLQKRLSAVMHKNIPLDYIAKEASSFVESFTSLLNAFSQLNITLEAYVCLKAITFLHECAPDYVDDEKCPKVPSAYVRRISVVQEQFVKALQIHLSQCQNGPRMTDIFNWIPTLQATASVLLKSKMFYMPFLICKNPEPFSAESSMNASPTHSETESDDTHRNEQA
uniref:NR LBD domain-containing protein n=1 Tax=Acrobeloides nanus TaxID=290746 RepID=A0A914EIH1_9BILA